MPPLAVWVDDYTLRALPSLERDLALKAVLVMRSFTRLPNPATVGQLGEYRQVAVVSGKDLPHLVSRIEMATTTLGVGVIGVLPHGAAAHTLLRGPGLLDVLDPRQAGAANRIALMSEVPIVSARVRGAVGPHPSPPAWLTTRKAARARGDEMPGLAIASSTGGCWVLAELIRSLNGRRPGPVFVAQHIDSEFASFFAEWLESATERRTVLVHASVPLEPDVIYIPEGGMDLCVAADGRQVFCAPASKRFVPSADRLLSTFAEAFNARGTAVVLSGMGNDGAAGVGEVLRRGGKAYCQSPGTAIVPSMPESALAASPGAMALDPEALMSALCITS